MRVEAFHYELPAELVAQHPAPERESAKLMLVHPAGGGIDHRRVADLPELLPPGALLVANDTRVIPARLLARKRATGGSVEWLLVRRTGTHERQVAAGDRRVGEIWRALGKGVGPFKGEADFNVAARGSPREAPPALVLRLLGRSDEDGLFDVFLWSPSGGPIGDILAECGHVPLPPYIKRDDTRADAARYQTVYARRDGAVAAPTAGLHFTQAMLERLASRGCEPAFVTLHVGLGTFLPVQSSELDEHPMHAEHFEVTPAAAAAIAGARKRGAPVVAVGTTSARALESAADPDRAGHVRAMTGETRLLIQPGYTWRVVDALFTNFHQPRSTLMALVCAFAGIDPVLAAYRAAVRERYRFFSYGDAMLLWRGA